MLHQVKEDDLYFINEGNWCKCLTPVELADYITANGLTHLATLQHVHSLAESLIESGINPLLTESLIMLRIDRQYVPCSSIPRSLPTFDSPILEGYIAMTTRQSEIRKESVEAAIRASAQELSKADEVAIDKYWVKMSEPGFADMIFCNNGHLRSASEANREQKFNKVLFPSSSSDWKHAQVEWFDIEACID